MFSLILGVWLPVEWLGLSVTAFDLLRSCQALCHSVAVCEGSCCSVSSQTLGSVIRAAVVVVCADTNISGARALFAAISV